MGNQTDKLSGAGPADRVTRGEDEGHADGKSQLPRLEVPITDQRYDAAVGAEARRWQERYD